MRRLNIALCLLISATLVLGCGGGSSTGNGGDPAEPAFSPALFSAASPTITNPYFPLVPGATRVYQEESEDDGPVTIVEEVLDTTRIVAGVVCAVVRVDEYEDELLVEQTFDWYAQDDAGNVWYMGEDATNYEYDDDDNLESTDKDGSWEAGADVASIGTNAEAGILMKAVPVVGDTYRQEYYPGEAEDMGEIIALSVPITLEDGSAHTCLQIRDWDPLEEDSGEFKYFEQGTGLVMEEDESGEESAELRGLFDQSTLPDFDAATFSNPTQIDNPFFPLVPETVQAFVLTEGEDDDEEEDDEDEEEDDEEEDEDDSETVISEVLDETRVVNGVECVVVRVLEFEGELLVEDTHDWYAQDDAGNVWYMGEEVVNYEYDDEGELVETNNDGEWEAGVDDAEAGIIMLANPIVGASYFQEFYEDEAEDLGAVVALGVTVELGNGVEYTNCVQILDWTPLEPAQLEYKFYAPSVGLIVEQSLDDDELFEFQGQFDVSENSLPDFDAATFTAPTLIDNPYLPFAPGSVFEYEAETEDGVESILVEVLADTRLVNGVECVVVRDRVYIEGLLIEDTHDWYAQDDAGNVWYMGEEVVNYEYDDEDNLIETNDDGSWEAGVDDAEAGILMWATPLVGASYLQEFWEDEAEDRAVIIAIGVEVELEDETVFENCLRILEWTALEPGDSLETKFYAPGIGVVLEEKAASGERVELTGP